MAKKLKPDPLGYYRPYLGWKEAAPGRFIQHRFNLGRELAEAKSRFDRLERVWEVIERRWQQERLEERPLWDEVTLCIGKSIANGEETAALPVPDDLQADPGDIGSWLRHLQQEFPFIKLTLADNHLQQREDAFWEAHAAGLEAKAKEQVERAQALRGKKAGATLHQALDAYAEWIKTSYVREGHVTGTGRSMLEQVRELKTYGKDCSLVALDGLALHTWVRSWANRPVIRRTDKPCAVDTAKDLIKRIRAFTKWLNSNSAFDWTKPNGFEWERVKIATTAEENARSEHGVKRFRLPQIATLWQYATPQERLYIVLGLNCGFGRGEIGTLQLAEVNLDKRLIKRLRTKTTVQGKWRLWNVTVAGIRWYLDHRRPETAETALLVNRSGKSYQRPTAGGNKNNQIYNAFNKLIDRIHKDDQTFPRLSFNKLRKTSSNLIRAKFGGEVAEVFLSHKALSKSQLAAYTDSPYRQVFRAIRWLGRVLEKQVFSKEESPWHCEDKHPAISLGTIKKIQAMRRAKHKPKWIAEQLGVSVKTVYRYK